MVSFISKFLFTATVTAPTFLSLGLIGVIKDSTNYFQLWDDMLAYIIHSGFISGYQNRYGDNLKPPTNVYHRMTA